MFKSKCSALFLTISLILTGCTQTDTLTTSEPAYVSDLFDNDLMTLDILVADSEWQSMLENATDEEYIKVDVVVNGTTFHDVGIRPKGNSSLTQVANSDSNRFSFRLKFDEYVEGQNCFGLDTFVLNNMVGDNSYMKEYLSFDLMQTLGVDTPLFGYSNISVNGEKWGLYLAIEAYNDSFLNRVFGDDSGELYNVKMTQDAQGNKQDFDPNGDQKDSPSGEIPQNINMGPKGDHPNYSDLTNYSDLPPNNDATTSATSPMDSTQDHDFGGKNGMGAGSSGGSLQYIDDSSSSYPAIFENGVGKTDEEDYQKVIAALKTLESGQNLEDAFDVDEILRYLAAHTFVVNLDSYTSNMAQNFYLYESDGILSLLPWDYNLAWGGFNSNDASSVVNFPIDTPVSGVEMSERPLISKLLSNETYLNTYHEYLQTLIESYFEGDNFNTKIDQLKALISPYVQEDSTAFCTYEAYQTAVETLKSLGNLRAESVKLQLDGTIPSTIVGQTTDPDRLLDASNIDLSLLGNMGGGKDRNQDFPKP